MPLTLADASRLSPLEGAVDPAFDQWRQKNEIEGSPEVVKGWTSAGLGSQANSLYTQALKAQIDGDQQQSDVLRAQAQDLDQQTAQWAPRVQNVTDVRSLRDGADWLGGAMGNLRTSVAPAAAGLAGSITGLAAAPFTGGIVNPVTAGFAAASAAGYDAEADESAAAAMRDPNVMARNIPEEVLATARLKGIGNSALEAAVPTVMGGRLLTGAGVKALGRAALGRGATQAEVAAERAAQQAIVNEGWKGAAKTVGANVAEGAAGEFTTESAQSLVGQAAQNSLLGKDLTDFDYKQAFNEGAAGAVAGGGMGVVGGAGQVGHAYLGAGTQAVKDTARDVAADPVGKAADLIADAGGALGKGAAKALDWYERSTSEPHKALDSLVGSNISPELVTPQAMKWAQFVMGDKNSTPDELADAKDFVTRVASGDVAAAEDYRNKLTVKHYERLNSEALNGISDEIESRLPKQSKMGMTEQGNISAQLSDLWLSTEGKNFGAFKNAASPDEAKRTALMLTHWVASGFGADHNDGETFIPTALVDGLGTEAAKVVLSLAKIAKKQGLYKGDDKMLMDMYNTVKQSAQDSSSDTEIIDQLLTPLAHASWNDTKTKVLSKTLRSSGGKVSKAQASALQESFGQLGTIELLKHFRERPEKAAKYGKALDIEGGVPVMDEGGDVTTDYESGLTERDATSRVSYQGQGKKNTPFNTLHEQQKNNHTTLLSTFKNQPGVLTRTVGVHDALKEQYGKDHNYLREAENEAMWAAVKKMNSSKAEREEYMQHLDSLSEQERASQLKALNKTHKLVRVEQIEGDAVADQIRPDQVESFREERGERSTDVTPDRGILYLERKGKVDEETGEVVGKDEDFLTSTHRLIKHTWAAEKRESEGRTDGDAGQGAKGEYEALLRGIAALVQSDGTFTGRVGFRMKPGDKVRYVKAGSVFPQELKMVSGTVLDAEKRHAVELSRKKADHWGAELGDEIQEATDNDNIVPSEHRGEKPIYRDSDGARIGAGEDAAGYEGNSRGGSGKGAEPVMLPLATAHTEGKLPTVPRNADAMKELLSDPDFPKGSLRILTSTEASKLEHAIFSVKDLLGKMWNISHVAVAREGAISHLAEAVPLSDGSFAVVLKERLFSASPHALQAVFCHEVAHTFSWMKGERELFNEGGEVARLAANIPKTSALATLFRYPLDKQKFPEADFANELHAQAFAAYSYPVLKRILKRDAPELFALLKELYGTKKTRTDRGDLQNSGGVLGASTSGSGQLGGEARNTVREGDAANGADSSSERRGFEEQHSLEQYLKLAEGKNAVLTNALKREIARLASGEKPNGNTVGVLKAAEKQFGALKQEQAVEVQNAETLSTDVQQGVQPLFADNRTERYTKLTYAQQNLRIEKVEEQKRGFKLNQLTATEQDEVLALFEETANMHPVDKELAYEKFYEKVRNRLASAPLSTKELDDAIYDESYGKIDSLDKLQQFAMHVNVRYRELELREEFGETLSERDEGIWSLAGQLVFEAQSYLKNPNSASEDFETWVNEVTDGKLSDKELDAAVKSFVEALAGKKQSTQTANTGTTKRATKEEQAAAKQHILDTLGDSVKSNFVKHFGDNSSGSWTPGKVKNIIRLALNGDVLGTAYHESLHEFFDQLKKAGSTATQKVLQRVATNPIINRKIERLLADHPAAADQVRNSPEEAAAFMYQFWRAGLLKLGPEGQTLFEKIKSFFAGLLGKVSAEVRDMQHAEEVMQAFSSGVLKEDATRDAVLKALNTNAEAHTAALENLDKAGRDLVREFGKVFFSSEAMLKGTKNKYMRNVAQMFHQETGEGKGDKQALLEATRQQMNIWTNRLENILTAYKPEDLELAREALSKNVPPKDRIAKEIVAKITNFNEDMFKYITSRGVKRLDDEGKWVPVQHRADYFRRVWDTDVVRENAEKFKSMLLEHHPKQLQLIADQANAEIKSGTYVEGSASAEQMAKKPADRETVTPEMVADAIIARLLNANGQVELEESTSSLGMSPVATSVNRRTLSWIDPQQFDEFTSKDIVNIMSGYVSSMVKRAEYTRVFGNTGEGLRSEVDKATLHEMGGDELVRTAWNALPGAIKQWKAEKADAMDEGMYFDTPFPTLMSVGLKKYRKLIGDEAAIESLTKARKVLSQGYKAIMAMEGTLGADMAPGLRKLNSALATYQSFRVLPLVLFSSINDVMGVVVNEGKLGDAWNTFVSGIKEIKNSWAGTKSDGRDAVRAEEWGTVEATTRMEALGQLYGSMYMTGKARKLSNSFFKWNGMEGFNRGVRIAATVVAENAIKAFKTDGLDKNDAAAVARFEELFGKGFKPENIALDANGDLDIMNPVNQAAVMRWVSKAVMSPNAAHRPIWGSDARMASVWMLKQFAYTFHRVMLKNAVAQAKLGNLRPALVMAVGYAPVAIAADVVKEALIPGDDPPWMKMGLGSYLQHGVSRAGLFGVPGMIYDSAVYDYGVGLLGPTASQAMHAPFDPVDKTMLGALPAGGRLKALADE